MKREMTAMVSFACLIVAVVFLAHAQRQTTLPRVGILQSATTPDEHADRLIQALRDLGYVDGKNVQLKIGRVGVSRKGSTTSVDPGNGRADTESERHEIETAEPRAVQTTR